MLVAAFAAGLSAGGCRGCAAGARPNLVLVSIDSLRADHVGCYGYLESSGRDTTPHLDRMAAEGVRVERTVATTSWTLPSHLALMTGLDDVAHGVLFDRDAAGTNAVLDATRATLAEILRGEGYRTAGIYSGPYLHPNFGFGRGFDLYESAMPKGAIYDVGSAGAPADTPFLVEEKDLESHQGITSDRILDQTRVWLETEPEEPWFLFLHFFDVHYDYTPPPPYHRKFDPDYAGTLDGSSYALNPRVHPDMDPRDLEHLVALYDGEIAWVDDHLGQLRVEIESRGLAERTAVVVTADHGEEFFEHGEKGHRRNLHEEVLRIPLVLWAPGRLAAGRTVDGVVSLVDVAPTLLELAGLEPGHAMLGRSFLPSIRDGASLGDDRRGALSSLLLPDPAASVWRCLYSYRDAEGQAMVHADAPFGGLVPAEPSGVDEGPWKAFFEEEGRLRNRMGSGSVVPADSRARRLRVRLLAKLAEAREWRDRHPQVGTEGSELPGSVERDLEGLGYR